MAIETGARIECDTLLLVATETEREELQRAAEEAGHAFEPQSVEGLGDFFHLGIVGGTRVNAVRTEVGPLSYGGSASRAIYFRTAMGATSVVQLGMAFGVMPGRSRLAMF